jgi:HSPB1-associated protein 1
LLLSRYVNRSRPVVITDVGQDWPAMKKWTPSYLGRSFGDVRVHVRGSRVGLRDIGDLSLSEYIDWLLEARLSTQAGRSSSPLLAPYHASHAVKPYMAYDAALTQTGLRRDIEFSSLLPKGYYFRTTYCWIGPEGASTPLHCDSWGFNLFYQVVGRKRFILFSPDETRLLYPSDVFEFNTMYSRVSVPKPDYGRFPRFKEAHPVCVTLNPGEILVLPRSWWHDVEALETSISVNCWVVRRRDKLRASYLLNRAKKTLHAMGLYARGHCTCHLSPEREELDKVLGWS